MLKGVYFLVAKGGLVRELLVMLVTASSLATSGNCAAISNVENVVAWKSYGNTPRVARYRDLGSSLRYSRRVPKVVRMAEATLRIGPSGPKVRVACNLPMVLANLPE
jgi:hypothetical protein